jgi:Ser/Thr protein kinase RdoA (MazF antagonist)
MCRSNERSKATHALLEKSPLLLSAAGSHIEVDDSDLACGIAGKINPPDMTPEVHRLFSGEIRDQCFSRFRVKTARLISSWHSFTFDAASSAGPCILKVTHSSHRTYDQVGAEIEWLLYLVSGGTRAPRIRRSVDSLCVQRVPVADGYFSVVGYEKLVGEPIGDGLWNDILFRRWGKLIGRLHRLSRDYVPRNRRYTWPESDFMNLERYIPVIDLEIWNGARQIIQNVKELPLSNFQYGLIHADVYQDNFFWADGELLLFDFDNCEYGHYISDVAIALYAALWRVSDDSHRTEFSERFLRSLFVGYREEHDLSRTEIEALPLFLQLREVLIYTVAKKMLDLDNLTPIQARLLAERGSRISQNQPIVDLAPVLRSL